MAKPDVIVKPSWRFCCQHGSFSSLHTGRLLAEAHYLEASVVNAAGNEVAFRGRGPTLTQREVVLIGAAIVGVAVDANVQRRLRFEHGGLCVEQRLGITAKRIFVEIEIDDGADRVPCGGCRGLASTTGGILAGGGIATGRVGARAIESARGGRPRARASAALLVGRGRRDGSWCRRRRRVAGGNAERCNDDSGGAE